METTLITGGAGFIGSNYILSKFKQNLDRFIVNLDALTYAGNLQNLADVQAQENYRFIQGNIEDSALLKDIFQRYSPTTIVNFAAETHVDRSILNPESFIETNIVGTFRLLEASKKHWADLTPERQRAFRFLHVSTDEVYGSLGPEEPAFEETSNYAPNSPYSASKAASDHLVRSYFHTYGLPTLISNCSNNFGPYQFPEKLIPLTILNALAGKPIPIYGDGLNIRDWLYVEDHGDALDSILDKGCPGEKYNIGGDNPMTNLEIVMQITSLLDELAPDSLHCPHRNLITHIADRQGHDRRYAINNRKITRDLGWEPRTDFQIGIRKTVEWYLNHSNWIEAVQNQTYRDWVNIQYQKE